MVLMAFEVFHVITIIKHILSLSSAHKTNNQNQLNKNPAPPVGNCVRITDLRNLHL